MRSFTKFLVLSLSLGAVTPAFAGRPASTPRVSAAATAAARAQRAPRAPRARSTALKVPRATIKWHASYLKGYVYNDGAAAMMVVVPHGNIAETTKREAVYDHGQNISELVEVTGLGASGTYEATVLGTVSAHDGGNIAQRIADDRIRLTIEVDGQRTVLVDGLKGDAVTEAKVKFNMQPGKTYTLYYDRTDTNGRVVGDATAYQYGRMKQFVWDGK